MQGICSSHADVEALAGEANRSSSVRGLQRGTPKNEDVRRLPRMRALQQLNLCFRAQRTSVLTMPPPPHAGVVQGSVVSTGGVCLNPCVAVVPMYTHVHR